MKKTNSHPTKPVLVVEKAPQRPVAAFSRIELMVVIAVIALLALLLTPALARSRVTAHSFQCQNNLRQIINGWRMYAADNNDRLTESMSWVSGSLDYSSQPANTNVLLVQQSPLWPYVKNLSSFKCPSDQSYASYPGAGRLPRTRSYSMSQAIGTLNGGAGPWLPIPHWRVYGKLSEIIAPQPAGLWIFVDEHPDSINDGAFAVTMDNQGTNSTWVDIPANYHEGGCGFSFADGHTEIHKWKDERTISRFPVTYAYLLPLNIVVSNSPDIAWVQARTSAE